MPFFRRNKSTVLPTTSDIRSPPVGTPPHVPPRLGERTIPARPSYFRRTVQFVLWLLGELGCLLFLLVGFLPWILYSSFIRNIGRPLDGLREAYYSILRWLPTWIGLATIGVTLASAATFAFGALPSIQKAHSLDREAENAHQGNPDLYGSGIRIGIYLELLSTLLCIPLTPPNTARLGALSLAVMLSYSITLMALPALQPNQFKAWEYGPSWWMLFSMFQQKILIFLHGNIVSKIPNTRVESRIHEEPRQALRTLQRFASTWFATLLIYAVSLQWVASSGPREFLNMLIGCTRPNNHLILPFMMPTVGLQGAVSEADLQEFRAMSSACTSKPVDELAIFAMILILCALVLLLTAWASIQLFHRKRKAGQRVFMLHRAYIGGRLWVDFTCVVFGWTILLCSTWHIELLINTQGIHGVGYDAILTPGQIMPLVMGILSLLSTLNMWIVHWFPTVDSPWYRSVGGSMTTESPSSTLHRVSSQSSLSSGYSGVEGDA